MVKKGQTSKNDFKYTTLTLKFETNAVTHISFFLLSTLKISLISLKIQHVQKR
jgi:hypothetical protein